MKKQVFMQVGARHISQLGRELVTDYVTALTELVKNSYDADAEAVEIIFENLKSNDGRIIIIDTGNGISSEDIVNKWAVIGTNNKIRQTHSTKYGRRYAGKKGIGRFSVERLAEHCTILSFTETERFQYFTNWNLYEGINIPEFIQRCEILCATNDISSAKYIKCAVEYLILSEGVDSQDKKAIMDFLGSNTFTFELFLGNPLWIMGFKNFLLPILEKYKDEEKMVQEIGNMISDENDAEIENAYERLKQLYSEKKVRKDKPTGTIMILDHLRDQWGKSDIEKIIKELILLVAPTQSKENNFKVSIKTEEYKDIERNELTNDVLDLAFAEVKAYFIDNEENNEKIKKFVIEYKENRSKKEMTHIEDVELPFLCGHFKLHLYYYVRDQRYLSNGSINQSTARKILDIFCGVKVYRDGFRVRPYGDSGNDWLLLDHKKIKDTHGYLVGNNQLIGEIEVGQEENPLLVDSTNREAIIENEAFNQLKNYVIKAIQYIQNVRFEEYKEERRRAEEEQKKNEEKAEKTKATIDKNVGAYLTEIDAAVQKGDVDQIHGLSVQLADAVAEERQRSDQLLGETKAYYEEQLVSKERELSLYKNLASLGILAGAFGHETGDVFARINNDIQLLKYYFGQNELIGDSETVTETCFGRLERDLNRVGSYSRLLLSFLKKNKRERKQIFNWGEATKNLVRLYKKILDSFDIYLDTGDIEEIESPIKMYEIDFESIIINLVTNAFEAVKNKENAKIKISIKSIIGGANIIVEDSGNGVPEDKKEWIFKPFNTTKKEDGVGLGLTILNDIVEKYEGVISVEQSSLGGAKFIIGFALR